VLRASRSRRVTSNTSPAPRASIARCSWRLSVLAPDTFSAKTLSAPTSLSKQTDSRALVLILGQSLSRQFFPNLLKQRVARMVGIRRQTDNRIKLYSRLGNNLTRRFPLIVDALERLRARTCILDGEAVVCGGDGLALFELVRHWRNGDSAFLYAFDLIELDGDDLRAQSLERRKELLARLLSRSTGGIQLNEHMEHDDGALVFAHACKSLPMSVGAGRLHSGLEMQAPDLASKSEGRFKAEAGTLQCPP
jgi:hypothetical protein